MRKEFKTSRTARRGQEDPGAENMGEKDEGEDRDRQTDHLFFLVCPLRPLPSAPSFLTAWHTRAALTSLRNGERNPSAPRVPRSHSQQLVWGWRFHTRAPCTMAWLLDLVPGCQLSRIPLPKSNLEERDEFQKKPQRNIESTTMYQVMSRSLITCKLGDIAVWL